VTIETEVVELLVVCNRMKKLTDHMSRVSSTILPATRVVSFRMLSSIRCKEKIRMLPSLAVDLRRSMLAEAKKR